MSSYSMLLNKNLNNNTQLTLALIAYYQNTKFSNKEHNCIFYHPLLHRKTRRSVIYCRKTA